MEAAADDSLIASSGNIRDRNNLLSRRDSRNRDSKGLSHSLHERGKNRKLSSRSYSEKALSHSSNGMSGIGRKGDSKGSSHSLHERGNIRRLSSRKLSQTSEQRSSRSSSRRRRSSRENRESSSHRRRSSERSSSKSSDRRRSSRHKYSSSRPSRTKSFDDIIWESTREADIARRRSTDNLQIVGRKISKEKSQRRRRRSRDIISDHDRSESTKATDALYGDHEDASNIKNKTAKGASKRAIIPGVEHVGSKSNRTINNTLYGTDSDANAKTKGSSSTSERATNPGVEQIDSSKTNRSLNTLYGSDADAKAKVKASARGAEPAGTPGVKQVSNLTSNDITSKQSATTSTLYGRDEDVKAKASNMSSEPAKIPGVDRVSTPSMHTTAAESSTAANTLYGDDANTKAKAKSSRWSTETASNPGAESILANNSTHTAMSTLYGSEADAKTKAKTTGGGSIFASNPGAASVGTTDSTADTLYGSNDAGAKARIRASRGGAAVPGAESLDNPTTTESTDSYHVQHVTIAEEPMARPVSIEMGHTDSESESISEPKRNVDAGGRGVSSEAMENLQLPNDPEVPSRRHGKAEKKEVDDEQKKSRKKRCIILFLFFLFLIGAAGVAIWYFLLRNDSGNEESRIGNTNIQDPTTSPSSPSNGTGFSPTQPSVFGNTTMFPSASPSERFIYDPPSKSDCQDIAANQTIAGRETMENADFELGVEVVLPENTTLTEPLLQALLDAIQRKILPSLAGCSIIIDELVEAWRFVIFDAFVTGSVPPGEVCTDEALMQLNCHRVSVKLDLFLKGNVRFLDIIALISAEGDNIANHLELDDLFSVIKLIGAESLIPTDAPTRMPSATPSLSPTEFPTVLASSNPTGIPSMLPTRATTGEPSLSPTMLPSEAPSMGPSTTAPTTDRSVQPTGVPSESPSVGPTIMFSESPTPPPTPAPSSTPSVTPTRLPSLTPTKFPSWTPTKFPSLMPSHLPSVTPTDSPSSSPSDSPTKFPTLGPSSNPSTSPTASPTPAPTYAVEIITQAHGPYTNYPVSQSTTGWRGAAILAIDGNNSGAYNVDRSVTHTLNRLDQWWQVDLATGAGRPVVVKHITVWNRTGCCTDRLIGAVVQLLDSNQNDITPSNIDNVLTDARETTIDYGLVPNVSFVKISKDYYLSLAEVEIYGYVPL